MDNDCFQTNLNTLKELILDEQKLVTYVTLSKELCIHVNESKQLLTKFVENTRNEQPGLDLNVCCVISGLTEDSKGRTTVVSEKEIQDVRKSLKFVFFEHIYSVCKGLPAVDTVAFLAVNKLEDFPLCTGLIRSTACVKRSSEEIGSLKSSSQVAVQVEQKPIIVPQKKLKADIKSAFTNDQADSKNITKVHESKSEPSIKTEVTSPKKDIPSSSKQKVDTKKNGIKSQKGIAGFFNKSNSVPSKVLGKGTPEITKELSVKKETNPIKDMEVPMDVDIVAEKEIKHAKEKDTKTEIRKETANGKSKNKEKDAEKQEKTKTEVKKETVKGKSRNKSLTEIKKTAKVDKKRKRVLHVSDSEDEDPFADEPEIEQVESEDEIPPTPVATVKITSGIINPKKRRKVVDKTYTDEEGYILTKKVEVYENCSDNEEEVTKENVNVQAPPVKKIKEETSPKDKKTAPKNTKKKVSPPQKGRQATLMNFFKKA